MRAKEYRVKALRHPGPAREGRARTAIQELRAVWVRFEAVSDPDEHIGAPPEARYATPVVSGCYRTCQRSTLRVFGCLREVPCTMLPHPAILPKNIRTQHATCMGMRWRRGANKARASKIAPSNGELESRRTNLLMRRPIGRSGRASPCATSAQLGRVRAAGTGLLAQGTRPGLRGPRGHA